MSADIEEIKKAFHMMWDNYPEQVRLIDKTFLVLDGNPAYFAAGDLFVHFTNGLKATIENDGEKSLNIIKTRKSVRSYDGRMLSEEDRRALLEFAEKAANPYGVHIEYRFLEPERYGLKSPVLTGETLYLAAKLKRGPHFEEALGYSLEAVCLKAREMGIGTVWIGGTMNREAFEAAMELKDDEIMPCVTPVGYPAEKRSIRENLMRKGIKADRRMETGEFAFEDVPGRALSEESGRLFGEALEAVRWAPSAVNKQPWRVIISGNAAHFYEKPDKGYVNERTGDLQKIDMGIALYHFEYAMRSAGKAVAFGINDPGISVPGEWQYTATYELK